jgi:hypothetical protein
MREVTDWGGMDWGVDWGVDWGADWRSTLRQKSQISDKGMLRGRRHANPLIRHGPVSVRVPAEFVGRKLVNPNRGAIRQGSPLTMSTSIKTTHQKRLMPVSMSMHDMEFVIATVIEESVDHRMRFA